MRLPQDRILHIGTELAGDEVRVVAEWQGELVRCEDCKHWTEEKDEEDDILYGWCRAPFENDNLLVYGDDATRIFTAYDFFCKSGERREP